MKNYIDMWTGWHVALASWGFMLAEKWVVPLFPNVHNLYIASATVIIGALLYELIVDFGFNRKAYLTKKGLYVNSFFDIVAALLAIGICLIISSV